MTQDELGAFVDHCDVVLAGAEAGPLAGLDLAVKDIFDVAGCRTGCGNPDWLRTHPPAVSTAPVVEKLVAAGATMVGKTVTDELAYSLIGENAHYGAPVNVNAAGRVTGGSSSGSAAAVAGGLADLALGSDTGGSVRIPASFCGVYGVRPTHGRIPLDSIMPLAASYDTIGWFAREPAVMENAARVLFDDWVEPEMPTRLLMPADAWAVAEEAVQAALRPAVTRLARLIGEPEPAPIGAEILALIAETYATLQGREAWETHREWIEREKPAFGPAIADRFRAVARIGDDEVATARRRRDAFGARIAELLPDGCLMALPAAPCIAPLRNTPAGDLADIRRRILTLTGIAGHPGLPQVSIPAATVDGCPVGLSIVAPRGRDEQVLALARRF